MLFIAIKIGHPDDGATIHTNASPRPVYISLFRRVLYKPER